MSDDKKQVTAEVDDRLDAFFSDDDGWGNESSAKTSKPKAKPKKAPKAASASPPLDENSEIFEKLGIKELKVLILSLDWEISDSNMSKLNSEVKALRKRWKDEPVYITYLSLLELLSKYIRVKKASANPESVTLLREVYESLENSMVKEGLSEKDKKKNVLIQVNKFNRLKKKISGAPASGKVVTAKPLPKAQVVEDAVVAAQPASVPAPAPAADTVLKEIRAMKKDMEAQLNAIKLEIKSVYDNLSQSLTDITMAIAGVRSAVEAAKSGKGEQQLAGFSADTKGAGAGGGSLLGDMTDSIESELAQAGGGQSPGNENVDDGLDDLGFSLDDEPDSEKL